MAGRFSILTPVGMLPIAVAGLNIDRMIEGSRDALEEYQNQDFDKNPCYQYAAVRNILYNKEKQLRF